MSTGEAYWWIEDIFSIVEPRQTAFASSEEDEFDVIVVGSGMAGSTAAALAHDAGSSVVILEASDEVGGTTYKSGAGLWIPNNSLMRELGIREDRDECLRYMVRIAHPGSFDPDADRYGATEWEWEKLTTYYENAADAIDALIAAGVLDLTFFGSFTERYPTMVSYHSDIDMSIQGGYRHLMPRRANGRRGAGMELTRQLGAAIRERQIPLLIRHRVRGVLQGPDGAVVGVKVEAPSGERTLFARQGVVFATGGFAHNLELLDRHWRGPLYSSCAVPTAQGDFVEIGLELGAELGNMRNGWLYEDLLEKAAPDRVCMEGGVNVPPGDSMIYVDANGERQVNEKKIYQDRAEVFWRQDENGDYPNRVMFMVYDDFIARDPRPWLFLDAFRPPKPWMIEGATFGELAAKVDERLADLEHLVGPIRLAADFPERLAATIERFNYFALAGKDEDFHRGEALHEHDWHGPARDGNDMNPTMYPFKDGGPYYCTLICGMVLDTNGGPKTNAASQVLRADGSVIRGLYGAGNCVAAVAGDGYLSGGSTLGPAATFAYLAARDVVTQPPKDLAAVSGTATA